ncbi:hypothetical protein NRIC_31050 [Enterococcus florum]|uniref:Alpha-ribazole-5-phosphate synthase n=1 Tax=Enterococcus florum TaxID=2480627 RepID=A0A4P5PEU5_9ENTE|nr:hypothetical protein [Enterococcus florum]GCF95214.1 hypothetical protein NRIC_31050 [Enterococcus florum]
MKLVQTYRDLSILPISMEKNLVIACDSSAGIGEKPLDFVAVDPAITAAFCLRVPLMELLCFGAEPICVIDLVGNEYQPTGDHMLKGIKKELIKAELEHLPINGSTEENMPTKTTSIGITVIGQKGAAQRIAKLEEESILFQLGKPYVGEAVVEKLEQIFSYSIIRSLRKEKGVVDLLPVGSKGIRYEANLMTEGTDYHVHFDQEEELDRSAGPATVVLAAVRKTDQKAISQKYPELKKIGTFVRR